MSVNKSNHLSSGGRQKLLENSMKTEAKTQDGEPVNHLFTSKTFQTMCETQSGGSTVQRPPDCVNIGPTADTGQVNNSDPEFYCAKIDRVRIPVSAGQFHAVVDKCDYHLVAGQKWYVLHSLRNTYAQNAKGELMHRIVVGAVDHSDLKVDHRDTNGLNNTRENLRVGTQSQNLGNQRQRLGTKSGFKGVCTAGDNKWRAEIGYKKKRIYLGSFSTKEEAAAAYNAKALELFGPFARINPLPFPTTQAA